MIEFFWISALAILAITLFFLGAKGGEFDIKNGASRYWSLFVYRDLTSICLPLLLLSAQGVERFRLYILRLQEGEFIYIATLSLAALIVFVACFVLLSRSYPPPRFEENSDPDAIEKLARAALVLGVSLLLGGYFFFSYKHALISAALEGDSLLQLRLDNAYRSELPSQIAYGIILTSYIQAIFAGVAVARRAYAKAIVYVFFGLTLAAARGDKAPVAMTLIVILFSYLTASNYKWRFIRIMPWAVVLMAVLYAAIYNLVALQRPDLSLGEYNEYLFTRLGIGQMAGVFESFSLGQVDGDFYLHAIPFASLFSNYISYEKYLMMAVEGYEFDKMGVKNSFFISEAYGIGGWGLLVFSPFIVAVSYVLSLHAMGHSLRILFGRSAANLYAVPIVLLSSSLTGGFSSFPLMKGVILISLWMLVIYIVSRIVELVMKLRV